MINIGTHKIVDFILIRNLVDYCKETLKYYLPAKLSFTLAEKDVPSIEKYSQERQLQKMVQQVLMLHDEGISQRKIIRQTVLSRSTIWCYISFPELAKQLYK